jgi:4-alpha-glucanotransferase
VVLAPGYYTLKVTVAGRTASSSLVVSPDLCYEPPAIVAGKRLWGVAVQLYAVRSRGNWGIGNSAELAQSLSGPGRYRGTRIRGNARPGSLVLRVPSVAGT